MNNILEINKVLAQFQTELPITDINCLVYCSSKEKNIQHIYKFNTPEEARQFAQMHNELAWGDYFSKLLKENEI